MKLSRMIGAGAGMVLLAAVGANAAAPPALYSSAQASAGATAYAQSCAMCHGADLKGGGGPALTGSAFASSSSGFTIGSVYGEVSQQMPLSAPGSLSATQDADIMAFLLSKNGYPAGTAMLDPTDKATAATPLVSQSN